MAEDQEDHSGEQMIQIDPVNTGGIIRLPSEFLQPAPQGPGFAGPTSPFNLPNEFGNESEGSTVPNWVGNPGQSRNVPPAPYSPPNMRESQDRRQPAVQSSSGSLNNALEGIAALTGYVARQTNPMTGAPLPQPLVGFGSVQESTTPPSSGQLSRTGG